LQLQEAAILADVASYCDANGISYYLEAGTLLGAVRHQGFIPWDDDIDTFMLRPDYERFKRGFAADAAMAARYTLYEQELGNTGNVYIKVSRRGTSQTYGWIDDYDYGINVEIFPLDAAPASKLAQAYVRLRALYLNAALWARMTNVSTYRGTRLKTFVLRTLHRLYAHTSVAALARRTAHFASKRPWRESGQVASLCGITAWRSSKPHTVAFYRDKTAVPFEGREYTAPAAWAPYLAYKYGPDYMDLPPENKRVSHPVEAYVLGE
jgi:lipopolysaccharide cholinephosphotransferase